MSSQRRKADARDLTLQAQIARQQAVERKRMLAQHGLDAVKQADHADVATPAWRVPEPPAPVFSECVVGFRVWTIDALQRLRPQSVNQRPWLPGINTAICDAYHQGMMWLTTSSPVRWPGEELRRPPKKHKAPHRECTCGLYARFNATDIIEPSIWDEPRAYDLAARTWTILGSIAAWGDMQVHRDGFRAEHACVTALALSDDMPAEIRDLVQTIAAKYRVPAVPLDTLEAEAMLHGVPLPVGAMPAPPQSYADFSHAAQMIRQMGISMKQARTIITGHGS